MPLPTLFVQLLSAFLLRPEGFGQHCVQTSGAGRLHITHSPHNPTQHRAKDGSYILLSCSLLFSFLSGPLTLMSVLHLLLPTLTQSLSLFVPVSLVYLFSRALLFL